VLGLITPPWGSLNFSLAAFSKISNNERLCYAFPRRRANCLLALRSIRLYLPRECTDDPERCRRVHVPDDVSFKTKPDIAIDLVDEADANGVPYETITFGARYGRNQIFLEELEIRHKRDIGGAPSEFHVCGIGYGSAAV
jgi:hypothetical protein